MLEHLELISGSDNYQYLTSHTAKEYLQQWSLTVVGLPTRDTRQNNVDLQVSPSGSHNNIFTLETLGDVLSLIIGNWFKFWNGSTIT